MSLTAIAVLFATGCEKGGNEKEPLRHDFDAPTFAVNVGEDFEEYRMANADYIIESKSSKSKFVMAGYVELEGEKHLLNIAVTKNRYDKVAAIVATPEKKSSSDKLFRYYLNNAEAEELGVWQGANWKTTSSGITSAGVHQTIEQALSQYGASPAGLVIDAIFSVASGKTYAVATIENNAFKFSLVESFYRVDFDVLVKLLGSSWSKLQTDNRYTSYKTGFGTLYYVWFYYAYDLCDNRFNMSAYADENRISIISIRLTMPEELPSEEQVTAWKQYAADDATLSLGEFRKAYLADSTGAEIEPLESQAAALAYVETNGRPVAFANNVVLEYLKDGATILITLDSKYVTIDIFYEE